MISLRPRSEDSAFFQAPDSPVLLYIRIEQLQYHLPVPAPGNSYIPPDDLHVLLRHSPAQYLARRSRRLVLILLQVFKRGALLTARRVEAQTAGDYVGGERGLLGDLGWGRVGPCCRSGARAGRA